MDGWRRDVGGSGQKERAMRTRTLGLIGLIGAGLVACATLHAWGPATSTASSAGGPPTMPAQAEGRVAAEGRVVAYPGAEVKVGAERAGRLVRVVVEEGAHVQKGQLLAEIDSDELRAELAEARARVAEADAEVRLSEATLARRRALQEQ